MLLLIILLYMYTYDMLSLGACNRSIITGKRSDYWEKEQTAVLGALVASTCMHHVIMLITSTSYVSAVCTFWCTAWYRYEYLALRLVCTRKTTERQQQQQHQSKSFSSTCACCVFIVFGATRTYSYLPRNNVPVVWKVVS